MTNITQGPGTKPIVFKMVVATWRKWYADGDNDS